MRGIKLLVFILKHGRGKKLPGLCRKNGIALNLILQGRGTAEKELMTFLGIGDPGKDVVILSVSETRAEELLKELTDALELSKLGEGVAFSIPFSAVASQSNSYDILAGKPSSENETEKAPHGKAQEGADKMKSMDLIVTVVNRGFADDVMAAAKAAGAFGGTVLNGRGTGAHELDEYLGVQLQPEKELVLILTPREERSKLMTAIARDAGLSKEGMGVCFSLPVDSVAGIRRFEENA